MYLFVMRERETVTDRKKECKKTKEIEFIVILPRGSVGGHRIKTMRRKISVTMETDSLIFMG